MKKYIILITILLLLVISSSGALAGSYSELEPIQKQFYWSCIKSDCLDFIYAKQYGKWKTCVSDCISKAETIKPIPVEELFCEDTDKGIDYKNFGSVTSNKYPNGKDDFCYSGNGKSYVFESACKNNKYVRYQKNCKELGQAYSCIEGACVNSVCDLQNVDNGVVAEFPDCAISCNEGYILEDNVCVKPNVPPVFGLFDVTHEIAVAGEFTIEIIATDDEVLEYSAENLPAGAELNGNIFTWTPGENQLGLFQFKFIVTDGEFTIEKTAKVEVFPNLGCDGIAKKKDYFGLDGHLFKYLDSDKIFNSNPQVKFKDINTGEHIERVIGGNIDQAYFDFKFYGKKYNFVSASDPSINDWDIMYKCNHAPVLDPIGNKKIKFDQELVIELSATDEDGDPLQYIVATMPVGAELNGNIFTWTPTKDQIGEYHVMFIVSDGELEDSEVVKISEDLECDDIVKDNEYFVLDNILLQYKGADKNTDTSPKIKFKNLNTGETLEYSVSFVNQQGSVTLKLGGKVYGFVSASDTGVDDFDIMYKCG